MKKDRLIRKWMKEKSLAGTAITRSVGTIRLSPYLFIYLAVIVAAILLIYVLFFKPVVIYVPRGEHGSHILPDGSQVWLNADSEIEYRSFTREGNRKIALRGEAFFRVVKGGPFEVSGEYGSVRVIGTSFNVNQRTELAVSCFKGAVVVTDTKGDSVKLKWGEFLVYGDSSLTAQKFNRTKEASWLTGDFYFVNASLDDVLAEAERQFDIEIRFQGKQPANYTGYFNNRDLDDALKLIVQPLSLEYTKDGNTVVIE